MERAPNNAEHADAILRVCSYHRRDFDLVLVHSHPDEMRAVQHSLQMAFGNPPSAGLLMLDRLPPELMSMVLHNLDLLSYFRFRQVNRRARVLSTSLPQYNRVAKHGLEGLRGLLRAKIAHGFNLMDLYRPLITPSCMLCGRFGGFMFLPTATRCCFACIRHSLILRVLSLSSLAKLTRISRGRLKRILRLIPHTVSGIYSMLEKTPRRPNHLVAEQEAVSTLKSLGLLQSEPSQAFAGTRDNENHRFMVSTAFPWYEADTSKVERGVSCKGCQVRVETLYGAFEDRDRVFSTAGFLTHFEDCEEAQALWTESQCGTRGVSEPEFTRRCGHFSEPGLNRP